MEKETIQAEINQIDLDIRRTTNIIDNLIQKRAQLMEKRTALSEKLKQEDILNG